MLFGDTVLVGMCMSPWRHYCALHAEYVHWCYGKCKRNCQCTCFFVPMSHRQKYPPVGGPIMATGATASASQMRVLPLRLATGPPPVGGANHGAWCYGECRGKCECFPLPPFFLVPYLPQNGGECCHTKAPPTFGGGQLRGGWPPPWGGPTSLPSCHWPPHSAGGGHGALCYGQCRGKCECFPSHPFFWCLIPPKTGGEVLPHKGPPHLWGGASCVEGGPLWGGQLPFPLATGPPIVWGGHGAWCYGQCRGKCECFPSHLFFWCLIPPQNGGECCHTKAPPPLGGGQLRGGWPPPLWGGQLPFPLAWPPP